MKTIIFDEKSTAWHKSSDTNRCFLAVQTEYLTDKCFYRGHLYLNEVYHALGIAQVPEEENVCYRESDGGISFEIEPKEDGTYQIHIN